MWVRSAFWIGRPRDAAAFRAIMDAEVVPALRALPGVSGAEALWPERREDDPPAIWLQVLARYATEADVQRMLASPARAVMRERVMALAADFDGTLSHIDYRVG